MRLLYGVQATGNGHITRARTMAPHFVRRGVDVQYLFSGRDRAALFDMEPFGEFEWRRGMTFATRRGRIAPLQTLAGLRPLRFLRDVRDLDLTRYDRIVTDFEPVTAWAARRRGIDAVGIAHQYAFHHPVPMGRVGPVNRMVIGRFAPVATAIGVHWHHFGAPIVPPLIAPASRTPTLERDKVLVYLPFEDRGEVLAWLQRLNGAQFYFYTDVSAPADMGSIRIRALSRERFPQDLASCSGVIGNAGFGLVSEAIQYGKKVLVKPLRGQVEQLANAAAIRELGIGEVMQRFDDDLFRRWLALPQPAPRPFPDVAAALVDWLVAEQREPLETVVERLWQAFGSPLGGTTVGGDAGRRCGAEP